MEYYEREYGVDANDVGDSLPSQAEESNQDSRQEYQGPSPFPCTLDSFFGGSRLEFPVGVSVEVSKYIYKAL